MSANDGAPPEPDDRIAAPSDELGHAVRWLVADGVRCLLAAAVIAFGFLVIAGAGGWPWPGIALVFVAVATAAATLLLRSPLWITVVVGVFVLLSLAPRWLVPEPPLAVAPFPLTIEQQSGWVTAAILAGLTAWFVMVVAERVQAARRAIQAWREEDEP